MQEYIDLTEIVSAVCEAEQYRLPDCKIRFDVTDSGIGMTEEEQKKVPTRFFKSDSSRNSSGYGLGMPIALKIAKKHSGTIEIESELGKGSCFTLYLAKNK
ncbi:MAG: ATP-binding protein [Ruminococcus flavefaciens]|nr:ATP-binding protein [Ruminococcus flavefaciens]